MDHLPCSCITCHANTCCICCCEWCSLCVRVAVSSIGPTMQQVLGQLCMSWDTRLTWLIHLQASCHVALMTFIDSSPSRRLRRHFDACRHRVVHSAHALLVNAVLHKAPSDNLPYVISTVITFLNRKYSMDLECIAAAYSRYIVHSG